jgi:hypothetical protein
MNQEIKDQVREKIIECSFHLTQSMLKNDFKEMDKIKEEISQLIEKYKTL